jgi:hypothetical protein
MQLPPPKRRHLADVLAAIPNVGEDSDFGRDQTDKRGCVKTHILPLPSSEAYATAAVHARLPAAVSPRFVVVSMEAQHCRCVGPPRAPTSCCRPGPACSISSCAVIFEILSAGTRASGPLPSRFVWRRSTRNGPLSEEGCHFLLGIFDPMVERQRGLARLVVSSINLGGKRHEKVCNGRCSHRRNRVAVGS